MSQIVCTSALLKRGGDQRAKRHSQRRCSEVLSGPQCGAEHGAQQSCRANVSHTKIPMPPPCILSDLSTLLAQELVLPSVPHIIIVIALITADALEELLGRLVVLCFEWLLLAQEARISWPCQQGGPTLVRCPVLVWTEDAPLATRASMTILEPLKFDGLRRCCAAAPADGVAAGREEATA
eukprot:366501-Chlamydomonas_euryale.AAC.27